MDAVGGHLALAQLVQDLVGGPEWRFTVAANRTGGRPLL